MNKPEHTHIHIHTYTHTHLRTYLCTYTHTHMHICTHTHTHAHTHTHTLDRSSARSIARSFRDHKACPVITRPLSWSQYLSFDHKSQITRHVLWSQDMCSDHKTCEHNEHGYKWQNAIWKPSGTWYGFPRRARSTMHKTSSMVYIASSKIPRTRSSAQNKPSRLGL